MAEGGGREEGEEGRKGNGEMVEREREGASVGGKRERETEKMRREEQGERQREEALYAFLSSRGFVCNNLCGKTA